MTKLCLGESVEELSLPRDHLFRIKWLDERDQKKII